MMPSPGRLADWFASLVNPDGIGANTSLKNWRHSLSLSLSLSF